MDFTQSNRRANAFTLVELLTVIGIIAILAALLLPVLSRSQKRATRVWCESNLRETGIAFQSFAHDHNSQFPMAVPVSEGGSREFVQNGYLVNGPFYFGFRHFQTLSNYLVTPKVLVCPADTRLPATNFAALQNSNLSYFVGVSADYSKPTSILAGDGNLMVSPQSPTLLRSDTGGRLQWTRAQHEFKGNVLFADSHVEEWGGTEAGAGLVSVGDFILPTVKPATSVSTANYSQSANSAADSGSKKPATGGGLPAFASNNAAMLPITITPPPAAILAPDQLKSLNPTGRLTGAITNPPAVVEVPDSNDLSVVATNLPARPLPNNAAGGGWLWLLLILLLALLAFQIWQQTRKNKRRPRRR